MMNPPFDFTYHNPTRICFGPQAFAALPSLIPDGARILMLTGGGSIRRNGVFDAVSSRLAGRPVIEFAGIEPNPTLETLNRAVVLVREQRLDFILAVGGGSVCDGAKFVACAAGYPGDGWDIVMGRQVPTEVLPVGVVLTLAATGSESNAGSVVTNVALRQKKAFFCEAARPRFAILDPQVLASLPDRQLANGLVDAFVHACEQYLTYPVGALVQDGYAEAVMRALRLLAESYERRRSADWLQNLMWAANQALSGLLGVGVPLDWATHRIAVDFTALYGIDHARTLSLLQPWLLEEVIDAKRAKLEQMGRRVFDLPAASAEETLAAIRALYRRLDMPLCLSGAGIDDPDAVAKVMAALRAHGTAAFGGHAGLDEAKTERIIRAACR